ncbi:MAG: hypothetical protein U0792_11140 [Gemmataceae bacterium]
MNLHRLHAAPPHDLATALARFEAEFTYPLGPGRTFRISHGDDYPRFYRSMGDAVCVVAERDGEILGAMAAVVRSLARPNGEVRPALYLGDLKITPRNRGGRVLLRLASEVASWVAGRVETAFAVVMGGTRVTPDRYTGRLGMPAFRELARVAILRVPTDGAIGLAGGEISAEIGQGIFLDLTRDRYTATGGDPAERSEMPPVWFGTRDGSVCSRLEDTRRAKRLTDDAGNEIVSAHLACFAYRDVPAGLGLLATARSTAAAGGFPAVFFAVPEADAEAFTAAVGTGATLAPATVYGAGIEPGGQWVINTSEV